MVVWHALMQSLLKEPDWYISTTFSRPPPLFTFPVIALYATTGALVADLLVGSVPLHLPYTWVTMALTSIYTLSVSVARHGRTLPTPRRMDLGWSGVCILFLSGGVSVALFLAHRLLHLGVKGRLERAKLLRQRSLLEARIATAEADAAAEADATPSAAGNGGGGAGREEDRLKRRVHAAALLDAMSTRDADDIFEEDD